MVLRILSQIEKFLKKHGMTPTRFGRLAVNDPALVIDLHRGRSLTGRTLERIELFMKQWEDGK